MSFGTHWRCSVEALYDAMLKTERTGKGDRGFLRIACKGSAPSPLAHFSVTPTRNIISRWQEGQQPGLNTARPKLFKVRMSLTACRCTLIMIMCSGVLWSCHDLSPRASTRQEFHVPFGPYSGVRYLSLLAFALKKLFWRESGHREAREQAAPPVQGRAA